MAFPVQRSDWTAAARPRCLGCGGSLDRKGLWLTQTPNLSGKQSSADIIYPSRPTEVEIQALVYVKLVGMGLDARCEVAAQGGSCYFDVVVFNKKRCAVRIIEIKAAKTIGNARKQRRKYGRYGLPVDYIVGLEDAKKYLRKVYSGLIDLPGCDVDRNNGLHLEP